MNFDLDLFEKTEAKEFGEFQTLELGAHAIIIVGAEEYTSEISGNTSLKISIDIAKGDKQEGFFKKQYDENTNADKKWPTGAIKYLSLKNEQLAYLKGFITSLQNSNAGFKFNTKGNWEQLKGLKLAGQFGLEEYEKQDGTIGTATKLTQFRSLDKLNEIKIPKVKLLDGSFVEYEKYHKPTAELPTEFENITVVSDDDLPFEI